MKALFDIKTLICPSKKHNKESNNKRKNITAEIRECTVVFGFVVNVFGNSLELKKSKQQTE